MAAATAEVRNYLRNQIGLGTDAQGQLRADAIIAEGIGSMSELAEFGKDDITTLCTSVRKPGGTIVDPADATRTIPNPGQSIPSMCETRLILAAYGASIYTLIDRLPILPNMLSRTWLKQFKLHKDMVDNHTSPEDLPEISKNFGIMKFIDQFPAYLREMNGVQGIPLSYVIRVNENPPPVLNNLINDVPWSHGPMVILVSLRSSLNMHLILDRALKMIMRRSFAYCKMRSKPPLMFHQYPGSNVIVMVGELSWPFNYIIWGTVNGIK